MPLLTHILVSETWSLCWRNPCWPVHKWLQKMSCVLMGKNTWLWWCHTHHGRHTSTVVLHWSLQPNYSVRNQHRYQIKSTIGQLHINIGTFTFYLHSLSPVCLLLTKWTHSQCCAVQAQQMMQSNRSVTVSYKVHVYGQQSRNVDCYCKKMFLQMYKMHN